MPIDAEPILVVKRSGSNSPESGPDLGHVRDRRSAFWAKAHLQPAAALVRSVLALGQFALNNLDRVFRKRGQYREGACQPALAELAVTDRGHRRLAARAVANGATCAATIVGVRHFGLHWVKGSVDDG